MLKRIGVITCVLLAGCGGGSGKVTGSVKFEGAGDASGAVVTLNGADPKTVVTGADGAFAFEGVADGDYSLAIEAADTAEGRRVIALQLADGKELAVPQVVMTAVGTVTGTAKLEGEPAAGIQVAVAGSDALAISGPDGSFTLKNAPAGDRTLVATRDGYAAATATLHIDRGQSASATIDVTRAQPASGTIQGTVAFHSGLSPEKATLRVLGLDVTATPDAQGNFTLKVPAGEYDLQAEADGYPRQTLTHVRVTPGALTDVGQQYISAYYHLRLPGGPLAYRSAQAVRLAADKKHAFVIWAHNYGYSYSIYDLTTDRDHSFFSGNNYLDVSTLLMSRDGGVVAMHDWSTFTVFDTRTGAVRAMYASNEYFRYTGAPTYQWVPRVASLSTDASTVFAHDGSIIQRMNIATGEVSTEKADVDALQVDADHYVAVKSNANDATRANTTLVSATGAVAGLSNVLRAVGAYGVFSNYLVAVTDCVGASCTLRVMDAVTGALKGTGVQVSASARLKATNNKDIVRVDDATGQFVRLSTGTGNLWPAGFGATEANTAEFNVDGTRIAFFKETSTSPRQRTLFVLPMPLSDLSAQGVLKSNSYDTEPFNRGWVSATRYVAADRNYPGTMVDVRNNTTSSDFTVVTLAENSNNAWVSKNGIASWHVDGKLMAIDGDSAPFVLSEDPNGNGYVDAQTVTQGRTWKLWGVWVDNRYTLVARNAAGEQKTFPGLLQNLSWYDRSWVQDGRVPADYDNYLHSENVVLTYRAYADWEYTLFDVRDGSVRSVIEPQLDYDMGVNFTSEDAPYIVDEYYVDTNWEISAPAILIF